MDHARRAYLADCGPAGWIAAGKLELDELTLLTCFAAARNRKVEDDAPKPGAETPDGLEL